jgi:signal transduction histidine kinase
MSDKSWKTLFLFLAVFAFGIAGLAIVDGLTPKPTDGLIWRLGQEWVIVEGVIPNGPGEKAGIGRGDIVLGIDHNLVKNPAEAASILIQLEPGIRVPYLIQRGTDIFTVGLTPYPYRTGDSRLLYRALVGLVFIGVGLYTAWQRNSLLGARLFYLMSLCFFLVLTCSFRGSPYYWIDLIIQNVARWGLTLLGPLFLHFFLVFPTPKRFIQKYSSLVPVFYLIPFIQHLLYTLSQYYVFTPYAFSEEGSFGLLIFGVQIELWALLGLYLIAGVAALLHSYLRASDPLNRRQIKLLIWGTFIGLLPFIIFSVIGAGIFGRKDMFSFGVLPLMAIPLSFAYSIIRYRLLEIQFIIKRSLLYSLLTGLFIGIYMVIVNVLGGWVERVSPFGGSVFGILFVLLIAISFEPTRFRLQQFINRLFYKSDYDRQTTLNKLTEALRTFSEMDELAAATLKSIDSIYQPGRISLSIISDRPSAVRVSEFYYNNGSVDTREHLLQESEAGDKSSAEFFASISDQHSSESIHIGGVSGDAKKRPPERLELPIFSHDKIVGLLSMSAKTTGEPYTLTELEALENFTNHAGLAIENLQLIQSITEANQRLFETEKLASLGQLASGVAHEIRNPLSSIKMNIQGMARSLHPDKTNSRRFEIIQKEIDHLDHIVQNVLIYARPSSLVMEPIDVNQLVLDTLELLSPKITEQNHKIAVHIPANMKPIHADRDKLNQVIKNLIVNAADAMGGHGVLDISGTISPAKFELSFKDSGPGIPKDEVKSIFNPFFTTKAHGTGLGLANARKFMQEMGGDIRVESESGNGAEFILSLPVTRADSLE